MLEINNSTVNFAASTLQTLAAAFADYFVFQALPQPDEKQGKNAKKSKKNEKKGVQISIPSMGVAEVRSVSI